MQLDGMPHITMITADAPANVGFYADTLGLRLVKQPVNFDRPEARLTETLGFTELDPGACRLSG